MKKHKTAAVIFGILALAWVYVLFFFSGQSGADSGSLSRELACRIVKWFPGLGMGPADLEPKLRKIAHFGIFAVEGFLLSVSLICATGYAKGAVLSALICIPMAAANEFHQRFSVGRSCEFRDMIIDSGGALTGIAAALATLWIIGCIARHRQSQASRTLR